MFNIQLEETLQTGLMKRLEELEECPFDLYHNDVLEVPEIQTFLKGRYYIEVLTETKPERQALLGILCGEVRFDYCSPCLLLTALLEIIPMFANQQKSEYFSVEDLGIVSAFYRFVYQGRESSGVDANVMMSLLEEIHIFACTVVIQQTATHLQHQAGSTTLL